MSNTSQLLSVTRLARLGLEDSSTLQSRTGKSGLPVITLVLGVLWIFLARDSLSSLSSPVSQSAMVTICPVVYHWCLLTDCRMMKAARGSTILYLRAFLWKLRSFLAAELARGASSHGLT